MPCWVVPSVASEIWHVPVDQILQAVRGGHIPSKHENGFTFIDVAPQSPSMSPPPRTPRPGPVAYKVPRPLTSRPADEPIPLPRPAEVITPIEMRHLHAEESNEPDGELVGVGAAVEPIAGDDANHPADAPEPLSMGDWRRGRRTAAARRVPPR